MSLISTTPKNDKKEERPLKKIGKVMNRKIVLKRK